MGDPQQIQQHTWEQVLPTFLPPFLPPRAPAPWGLWERREGKVGGWGRQPPPRDQMMSTGGQGVRQDPQPASDEAWFPRGGGGRSQPSMLGTGCPGSGKGWLEAAVSTLHCSSQDSVFLSPIYTLSVSGLSSSSESLTFSPAQRPWSDLSLVLPLTSLPCPLSTSLSECCCPFSVFYLPPATSLGARGPGQVT